MGRKPSLLGHLFAVLALAATSLAVPVGCASDHGGKITIGVKFDQPGLGVKNPDGVLSGFDIDVARYVAAQLGYAPGRITWVEAPSGQREILIRNGQVDYVVASYSITDARRKKIDFAGPYLLAGQSLLVRADNTDVTGAAALQNNKKLCSVSGSTPAQRIKDRYPGVQLQSYDTYSACVEALRNGAVDAVTSDDVILAGYAAQHPGVFKLAGKPFSAEQYGIGLKKDNGDLRDRINNAIEQMERDGSWREAFVNNLGASGLRVPAPPKINH